MVKSLNIIEQLLHLLIKLGLVYCFISLFGIIIGIVSFIIFIFLYHFILKTYFGLLSLRGLDKVFITTDPTSRFQVITISKFTNFNPEKLKALIINKQLKKIKKLRCKLTTFIYEYFWKEVSIDEAIDRIIIKQKVTNENELIKYAKKELNDQIDIFNEIPYQVYLVPYGENNMGAMIFKYDHLLSDALGLISSTCLSADNYSEEMFPKIIKGLKPFKWYELALLYSLTPFYFISHVLYFLTFQFNKSPFKSDAFSGNSNIAFSDSFDLKKFENFRKTHTVSFNEIMITSISIAMKKYLNKINKFIDKKRLMFDIPVGRKPLPQKMEDIIIENGVSGLLCNIPLADSVSDIFRIKDNIRKFFNPILQFALIAGSDICNEFFPNFFIEICSKAFVSRFDLIFTNVPGPSVKIDYGGMICEEMMSYPVGGRGLPFLALISYIGKFRFVFCVDEKCEYDAQEFLNYLEDSIKQFMI